MTSLGEARRIAHPIVSRLRHMLGHRSYAWLVGVVLAGLAGLGLTPYGLSFLHTEAGGRILAAVEAGDASAQAQLPQAVNHFQQALRWQPDNAYAHRLLGRTYLALDNPQEAVPALTRFTELRPDHPLGHWELALAYEQLWRQGADLHYYDLVVELPLAQVKAPETPLATPFCKPGDPPQACYVASTVQDVEGDDQAILFQYPPAEVTYALELPPSPTTLRLRPGLAPAARDLGSDGVDYTVSVKAANSGRAERLYETFLSPEAGFGEEARLDLSPYAGQTVLLTLATGPGPNGNNIGDLAGWVAPVVEDARVAQFEETGQAAQAAMLREWKAGGFTASQFIERGDSDWTARHFEDALEWYRRVELVNEGKPNPVAFRSAIAAVISQRMLTPHELATLAIHPLAGGSVQIEAETLQWSYTLANGWQWMYGQPLSAFPSMDPGAGVLWWDGVAVAVVQVPEDANYRLAFRAQHTAPAPIEVQVEHNFAPVAPFALDRGDLSWQELETDLFLSAGLHVIGVRFLNEYYAGDADRNAVLDWLRLEVEE